MRILLVHEYYRERGGEDIAFETDAELLRRAGQDVECLTFHNSSIKDRGSIADRIDLLLTTIWSRDAMRRVSENIRRSRPDVVHFHNTFPLVSPAAFVAAKQSGPAVVATLHNYRLLCANGALYRDGRICEDCLRAPVPVPSIVHACYRDSHTQSAAVAAMLTIHRLRRTWIDNVDLFIAPSDFLRTKMWEGGLPLEKIVVRPNAAGVPPDLHRGQGTGLLYVGRLAENKGVATIIHAWMGHAGLPPVRIAGAGILEQAVRDTVGSSRSPVEYLGVLSHEAVLHAMADSVALVFPSLWYENQPLTLLEASASGLPTIAARVGAVPEIVREGETGLLFQPGSPADLADKVRWAAANPDAMREMGKRARIDFESRFAPDKSIRSLLDVYEAALRSSASRRPSAKGRPGMAVPD